MLQLAKPPRPHRRHIHVFSPAHACAGCFEAGGMPEHSRLHYPVLVKSRFLAHGTGIAVRDLRSCGVLVLSPFSPGSPLEGKWWLKEMATARQMKFLASSFGWPWHGRRTRQDYGIAIMIGQTGQAGEVFKHPGRQLGKSICTPRLKHDTRCMLSRRVSRTLVRWNATVMLLC